MNNCLISTALSFRSLRAGGLCLVLALAGGLGGCSEEEPEIRTYQVPAETWPTVGATKPAAPPNGEMSGAQAMHWHVPAEWREVESTQSMRLATFAAGQGDAKAEFALTRLAGDAGGAVANVNRWRGQLGLPEADADAVEDALKIHVNPPVQAVWLKLQAPADAGDPAAPPTAMLAAMIITPTDTWFVKSTGPADVLAQHEPAFVAFVKSFHVGGHAAE